MRGRSMVEGSTGTRAMSGANTVLAARVAGSRERSGGVPGGSAGATAGPSVPWTKPQSPPNDGTATWYGVVARPAVAIDASIDQNASRADDGEPACTTTRAPGA